MKKRYVVLILAVFCLALAIGMTALAQDADNTNFNITMPTFGHKTLATGTKVFSDPGHNFWRVHLDPSPGHEDTVITLWVDANGSPAAIDAEIRPQKSINRSYDLIEPYSGNRMELRTKSTGWGGWYVIGYVNFDHIYADPV